MLTETDHPFGNRLSPKARPGAVEAAIGGRYSTAEVGPGLWGNLRQLAQLTGTTDMFPGRIQGILRAAPEPLGA